jgi:hypothetical protein
VSNQFEFINKIFEVKTETYIFRYFKSELKREMFYDKAKHNTTPQAKKRIHYNSSAMPYRMKRNKKYIKM